MALRVACSFVQHVHHGSQLDEIKRDLRRPVSGFYEHLG